MNKIIRAAVEHNRATLSALFVIFVLGIVSYSLITKEQNPDIPIPWFNIFMIHEGISPEDSERLLIKPMEVQLRSISGVKQMISIANEGTASIWLEFYPDQDHAKALDDIRDAVNNAQGDLPGGTEKPLIFENNPATQPILAFVLYGNASEQTFTNLAQRVKDELESLPNVLDADISGTRQEVLEIIIDPAKLAAYNLTPQELLTTISANNRLVAAGSLETGEGRFSIKIPGVFENQIDILSLPLKTSSDGVVTIGDLTEVRRTFKDPVRLSRMNGKPAVTIEVSKRIGTNEIETSEQVHALLDAAQKSSLWPEGIEVVYVWDSADFTREFLETLQNSVLSAILLVAVLVVAVLGIRSATIVGITIPGAFLFGIMTLYLFGYSINIVVMFGLILAVGLLVDGAIVVSEYADRKMLEGLPKKEAYIAAAQRMAWPITSSTLTTIAAFFPLLFWPDIIGEYMSFLPLTLIFVLAGSLIMALIFLPTLGSLFGKPGAADPNAMAALAADHEMDVDTMPGFTGKYARFLSRLVNTPRKCWSLVGIVPVVFIAINGIYIAMGTGTEFFPQGEPDNVRLAIHARGNLSPVEMDKISHDVEKTIEDIPGIKNIYSTSGQGLSSSRGAGDVISRINVIFEDWQTRRPADDIIAEIREATSVIPGIIVEPLLDNSGPTSGKDIQIRIASEITSEMDFVVDELVTYMGTMENLEDVEDNRPLPNIQWVMEVDRAEASRYGTNLATIGSIIQLVTNGIKVGEYRPDDAEDELDIRVRFPIDERGIEQLDKLLMPTPQGNIPISNFVKRVPKQNVSKIRRENSQRVWRIQANVVPDVNVNAEIDKVRAWVASQNFDQRVDINFDGNTEQQESSETFLLQALFGALFLMAMILITQFNSLYRAFLILSAVILSTVGVVLGLIITGSSFGVVMTGVGVIALAGIVVNNNIVLIDTYARLVKSGMEPLNAIVQTGAQRLRPVLLTTVTTVVGLMPMVFQFNIDFFTPSVVIGSPTSFIWVGLAQAIVFGLSFATVLTLILTPVFLALPVHFKSRRALKREQGRLAGQRLRRRFGRRRSPVLAE
ncbi:MAG: efflux RND transporter permease subunit [Proteobacteria bacterium]|nr:efflux RND transporter permease subunit [Pseudomonadota bacterium]